MLRGHGTLLRLIGKRRRLDPFSISSHLDAAPNELEPEVVSLAENQLHEGGASEPFILPFTKNVRNTPYEDCREAENGNSSNENSSMEWVQCPVCEKTIQGNNVSINGHLDLCLLGDTKCKSYQPTLLQFSRVPCPLKSISRRRKRLTLKKESSSIHLSTMAASEIAHACLSFESEKGNISDSNCAYRDDGHKGRMGCHKDGDFLNNLEISECSTNDLIAGSLTLKQESGSMGQLCHKEEPDSIDKYACNCSCHSETNTPGMIYVETEEASDCRYLSKDGEKEDSVIRPVITQIECNGVDTTVLQTNIVGRKFNRHVKVEKDMEIRAVREPDNPKDPKAIKIVGQNGGCSLAIGYLPQNLAFHLSCLLDKGFLDIQVFVDNVPEKIFESVPIKLFCEKRNLGETEDAEFFENTWQKVLQVVKESGKDQSPKPSQSKYLQNFVYLGKRVLEHDSHLFSEEELAFLGSFFTLTENAQCLFVHLFQRKGPWFRVSQTSYADIPDVKQASDELLAAGFMTAGDSLEKDECFEKAIRERMHVLKVPELKQLISMGHWKRKKLFLEH